MSNATEEIRKQMKNWTPQELQRFACKLLILARGDFHGSVTVHFANTIPKKIVYTESSDL